MACLGMATAQFRFANTLGDHMVLQQAPHEAIVWGFGTAGEAVSVTSSFHSGQTFSGKVGSDGTWSVALAPVSASLQAGSVTATSAGQTVSLQVRARNPDSKQTRKNNTSTGVCVCFHDFCAHLLPVHGVCMYGTLLVGRAVWRCVGVWWSVKHAVCPQPSLQRHSRDC